MVTGTGRGSLSVGAIVGVVTIVGITIGVALVIFVLVSLIIIWCCCAKRKPDGKELL